MIINSSSHEYSRMQSASDSTRKSVKPQPEQETNVQASTFTSSTQSMISGRGLMMSRLFGDADANPPIQTQATWGTTLSPVHFLTADDRDMLSDLYGQAQQQGVDLRYVDDLARDLGNYRMYGPTEGNVNNDDGIYDNDGHKLTFKFTEKDTATAERILTGNNLASSSLDAGFLTHELDPGFSFSHLTHFDFLEEVVNKFDRSGAGEPFDSKYANYEQTRNDRYVVETASEVTLHTEEPDYACTNGVFSVTETGMKHGFRLEGGQVVKDQVPVLQNLSRVPETLLDHYLKDGKEDDKMPLSFFGYLASHPFTDKNQEP
ncbi:hypothetical protein MUA04_01070 [Enterobacteriaceae bacterium H11S18]|uniref:hypothetical protein n=1 Tax=Dryocola clanedunensis TaxID=2925396 RepID=UPI0022F030EE|nr:hypothetical protein [Dryocola clanedunensis]MCT4708825.1 hypothetical protein [Dryocola clanedunensis]